MSRGARWTLALFSLLFAWAFVYSAPLNDKAPYLLYGLAGLCVVIAAACVFSGLQGSMVRLIGAAIFLACCWYIKEEINQPFKFFGPESEVTLRNAILAMIVFGFPGIYFAVTGKYPKWGKGAEVFQSEAKQPPSAKGGVIEPE